MKSSLEEFLFNLNLTYDLSGTPEDSMRLLEAMIGEYISNQEA